MGTMISEIYDALRDAGVSEEKSRKAAEVFANLDTKQVDARHDFILLRSEFNTVKWMLATNITLTLLVLGKMFLHP